jgi:hypothetical protein
MTDQDQSAEPGDTPAFTEFSSAQNDSSDTRGATQGDANPVGDGAEQASSLMGTVKEKAAAAISDQKDGLADRIDGLAGAVQESSRQFEGKQDWIAGAIERGSAELSALASSLRENDLASLLSQVKLLARRQPALFVGASLAAGFAIARLGKIAAADMSREDLPSMPEVGHGDQ